MLLLEAHVSFITTSNLHGSFMYNNWNSVQQNHPCDTFSNSGTHLCGIRVITNRKMDFEVALSLTYVSKPK